MNYLLVVLIFIVMGCAHKDEQTEKEVIVETTDKMNFDSLWNYGDPSGTRAKFRDLLNSNVNEPDNWRLQLQTQVARTLVYRHNLRKHIPYLIRFILTATIGTILQV